MGTFTAPSNVTGKVCDMDRITTTWHRHGALAFFDYATASAYTKIDMNPAPCEQYPSTSSVVNDAQNAWWSGHSTSGVLIIKKYLVSQVNALHTVAREAELFST